MPTYFFIWLKMTNFEHRENEKPEKKSKPTTNQL